MRRVARGATCLLLAAGLAACGGASPAAPDGVTPGATTAARATPSPTTTERTTVTIASLKGPTTMGLVGLMAAAEAGEARQDYQVTVYGTPDEVVPLVVQGQVDAALLPANLAAVVHQRTLTDGGAQVQVAAVTTLGVLAVLEHGDTVHSLADLAGRTVYSAGKGASPQHVLDHLLTRAGLDPTTDVTVEYRSEHTEVAALLAATPGAIALLPQPFATTVLAQAPDVRTALDLTDEWARLSPGSQLVTGVLVVRTAFAAEHPQALADLLAECAESTRFTNEHPAEAATLVADAGLVPTAAVAEAAIPASHLTFLEGAALRSALGGYLQVLFDADPASVGGSLPGDDLYLGG